jgi:hypothetical protein
LSLFQSSQMSCQATLENSVCFSPRFLWQQHLVLPLCICQNEEANIGALLLIKVSTLFGSHHSCLWCAFSVTSSKPTSQVVGMSLQCCHKVPLGLQNRFILPQFWRPDTQNPCDDPQKIWILNALQRSMC